MALNGGSTEHLRWLDADYSHLDSQSKIAVSFWANIPETELSWDVFVQKITSNAGFAIGLWESTDNDLMFTIRNGSATHEKTDATAVTWGTWQHHFFQFDGSEAVSADRIKYYIDNGSDVSTGGTSIPTSTGNSTDTLKVLHADCSMAEVAIWTGTVITDDERTMLSKKFSPLFAQPESLGFYAPLIRDFIDIITGKIGVEYDGGTPSPGLLSVVDHPGEFIRPAPKFYSFAPKVISSGSLTFDIDALLQKTLSNTFSVDSLLSKNITVTLQIDSIVSILKTIQTSVDAQLWVAHTKQQLIDALLKNIGVDASLSVDAILYELGQEMEVVLLDALLLKMNQITTCTLDALICNSFSKTASIDSILCNTLLQQINIEALLKGEITSSSFLDAVIYSALTQTNPFISFITIEEKSTFITTEEKFAFTTTDEIPAFIYKSD